MDSGESESGKQYHNDIFESDEVHTKEDNIDMQSVKDAQSIQNAEGSQDISNTQLTEKTQGTQDKQGAQSTQGAQRGQNTEESQDCKAPQMASHSARAGKTMSPPPPGRGKNKRPKKPMNGWLVAFCVLCGCIAFVFFWGNVFTGVLGNSTSSSVSYVPSGDTIDVINIEGTIAEGQTSYNHVWTLNRIDALMENTSNKAIMLYVNSPGGGIYESDELYLKLKEYKEVTGRPVYAYMAQTAASGGLYVCMAADKIYANRMTMTGSIGVIMSLTDTTGLQDLVGIKTENIVSGKNKAMGNPLTEDQRAILQSLIDESYEIFVDIVAEGRGLDRAAVKKLADGRVYSPTQAKELGLIDEIADFDSAVSQMKDENNLGDCELYYDQKPISFWEEIMYGVSSLGNIGAKGDFSTIKSYIDDNKDMKLMYMMGE